MIDEGYTYETLKQISPQKIRLYLTSCGWEFERKTRAFDVFSDPGHSTIVTVPNSRDYSDYAYRVEEVVKDVSKSRGISLQRVIAGMTISASTDTIEYHYEPENGEVGLIPVPDLLRIIDAGNDLNNYAYRDAIEFRKSYPSSNWKGKKVLEGIRVGPSVPGSYIVQFIYPLMDQSYIDTNLYGEVVTGKTGLGVICDRIESSLSAIIEAAERNKKELDPECNISYNFVESVMDLGFDRADIEVLRTRTIEKPKDIPRPQILSKDIFPRISVIESNMRPEDMRIEQEFIGRIVAFKDPREEPGDGPADITITFLDTEGKACNASLTLSGDDLDVAYDAAKKRMMVRVSGTLIGGRSKRIEDVKDFRVLRKLCLSERRI